MPNFSVIFIYFQYPLTCIPVSIKLKDSTIVAAEYDEKLTDKVYKDLERRSYTDKALENWAGQLRRYKDDTIEIIQAAVICGNTRTLVCINIYY